MHKQLWVVGVMLGLVACQPAPEVSQPVKSVPLVVVSGGLQATLNQAAGFGIAEAGNKVWLQDADAAIATERQISEQLRQRMAAAGLVAAEDGSTRYLFRFELGTDQRLSDDTLQQQWGLNPGYAGSGLYPKGAMVLDLFDRQTGLSVWRGAVQSDVLPAGMAESVRRARIDSILDQLLSQLRQQFPNVQ